MYQFLGIFTFLLVSFQVMANGQDLKVLKELEAYYKKKRKTLPEQVYHVDVAKPWSLEPYEALLRSGSIIMRTKDQKRFKTNKNFYLITREEFEGSETCAILNIDLEAVYLTKCLNLISLKDDMDMNENLNIDENYGKPIPAFSDGPKFKLRLGTSFSTSVARSGLWEGLFPGESVSFQGGRWDFFAEGKFTQLSLHPGVIISFDRGTVNGTQNEGLLNSLQFGAYFKYNYKHTDLLHLELSLGTMTSLTSSMKTDHLKTVDLRESKIFLSGEISYETIYGRFHTGVSLNYESWSSTFLANENQRANIQGRHLSPTFIFGCSRTVDI